MKKLSIAFITLLTVLVSCKKDSDNNAGTTSRTLRYEVTGNFSGQLIAAYTTASGGTTNDQITLPYTKEINYASSVTGAIIALSGSRGVVGQKVTLIIKRGGKQVGTPIVKVVDEPTGSFSISGPAIVF